MLREIEALSNVENENINIWRYMDFIKFMSLIDRKSLFFARADKFEDKFEGSYSKFNVKHREESLNNIYNERIQKETLNNISYFHKNMRKHTFINCWHMNEYESEAMWRLYLKNEAGISIQSTYKRLKESLQSTKYDVYIQKVFYRDYEKDPMPEGHAIYPFLFKRKSFEYEKELRAIIQQIPLQKDLIDLNENFCNYGIEVNINLNILIEKIYISPFSPSWFYELVKAVVKKYGFNYEVKQSNLKEDPLY